MNMSATAIGTSQAVPQPSGSISSLMNSALRRPLISSDTISLPRVGITVNEEEAQVRISGPSELVRRLSSAKWFVPTIVGLVAVSQLPGAWNSYGGTRIQPKAVETMLETLMSILGPDAPPPAVVPSAQGGVQVEWHQSRIDLEIEATPSGTLEIFYKSPVAEYEGTRNVNDLTGLREFADRLVNP